MVKNLSITNSTRRTLKKKEVHKFVHLLMAELKVKIKSLTINFVTEEQIIPINNEYLGHNFSTDIITFNYSEENYTLDGEIFISLDDASYNAVKYKIYLHNEVLRLIIHGFLHMLGYNDKLPKEKRIMKKEEDRLVHYYFNSLTKLF